MSPSENKVTRGTLREEIRELRERGWFSDAIGQCDRAIAVYPTDWFFLALKSDLLLEKGETEASFGLLLRSLRHVGSGHRSFAGFARRYGRFLRAGTKDQAQSFASKVMALVESRSIPRDAAMRAVDLVKSDLPEATSLHEDAQKLARMLREGASFEVTLKQARLLDTTRTPEFKYVLDRHVLDAPRSEGSFRLDCHWVSAYERLGEYDSALKVATELLHVRLDAIVIRSIFRICRNKGDYTVADRVLEDHPPVSKDERFPVLYEMVYYFEAKDNLDEVTRVLSLMASNCRESVSIQQTLSNFYLRFGMQEEYARTTKHIRENLASGTPSRARYGAEVVDSELAVGSKVAELYSKLEHQTRLAAISDLTRGISHELGQPITNIRYTVQFYKRRFQSAVTVDAVDGVFDSILEETERMGALVKRLAPVTSSASVVEQFDIVDRIRKRFRAEGARLARAGIAPDIAPASPVYMRGDPVKIDQVISNLLLNSIDACNSDSRRRRHRIRVRVSETQNETNMSFADTGTGIPVRHHGKLFDPFFTTKAPGRGEGLGLFIVWNVLKMHGGKIALDRGYRQGARFLVSIPKDTVADEGRSNGEHDPARGGRSQDS